MRQLIVCGVVVCFLSLTNLVEAQNQGGAFRERIRERIRERMQENVEKIPPVLNPDDVKLYGTKTGTLKPVSETTELKHPESGRSIPLRLTYPQEGENYPVIVFCHGAGGSGDFYQPLVQHWVSHGYVVLQPTFGDSISLLSSEDRSKLRSASDFVSSINVTRHWNIRPQEVTFVLDSLPQLEQQFPAFAGKCDQNRMGISGHSYGAHTTMILSGMTMYGPANTSYSLPDPRFSCAVSISPQGTGQALTHKSYATMKLPHLMITGDLDSGAGNPNLKGEWRREAYDGMPEGEKYLLWIKDAYHGMGGIAGATGRWSGAGPMSEDQVLLVKSVALTFFDAYLKQDETAQAALKDPGFAEACQKLATLTSK
ncbi:MAG: hypothetical protein KDA78_10005 [Planctomycetaceae bacterium]|nr:hypothetical protein [Planctomycetaceae bacterium]